MRQPSPDLIRVQNGDLRELDDLAILAWAMVSKCNFLTHDQQVLAFSAVELN